MVRRAKQERRAKTANGKRSRSKKSLQAARAAREPWLLVASTALAAWAPKKVAKLYRQRMQIEAGFREIKQEIGSAETQTRTPDAVTNHLHFCMAATAITWLYGASLEHAPPRRYATHQRTEYAFADLWRRLAQDLGGEGFGIDCVGANKPTQNPLIAAIMKLVA